MLNTTTNLTLKIEAKTANSTTTITGVAIPQKFKVGGKQLSYGSTTITGGYITKSYTTSVSSSVASSGTSNEVTTFTTSSIIPYNKPMKIAELEITPDAGFRISKTPFVVLSSGRNRGMRIFLKRKAGNVAVAASKRATWDIMCSSSQTISVVDNVQVSLNYSISKLPVTITNTINKINFGSSFIKEGGGEKHIKIYGTPNTPFELSILNSSDTSVLSHANTKSILPIGDKPCFSSTLDKKGYYCYVQKMPKLPTIRSTKVNGSMAVSGATRVIFDNLTDVQVGDRIYLSDANGRPFNKGETIKVITLNPTGGNANECDLSRSITAIDNKPVSFKRSDSYKINIETSGTKSSNVPITFPTKTIYQPAPQIIQTLATTSNAAMSIDGGGGGVDKTIYYGTMSRLTTNNAIYISLVMTGKTWTQSSDWNSKKNFVITHDETEGLSNSSISVDNITSSGSGTATYGLRFIAYVNTIGQTDATITVHLDNIIT